MMAAAQPARQARGIEIVAEALTRRFGDHVAVDSLDLVIPANTTYGLLGPNGAGKTTFIRMVTGFLLPSAGRIRVGGFSPIEQPRAVRQRIGFVMETSRLYPELRVDSFLRFAAGARGLYHVTNSGACTWHELAVRALDWASIRRTSILPVSTANYPLPAPRPANSVLANARLLRDGLPPLRPWPEAVQAYIGEM